MLLRELQIPIELTNNNAGRTTHFGRSAAQRRKYERIIRAEFGQQKPYEIQVDLVVIRVLGKRQRLWDASSILRGNWKEIEDAIVACGFLSDDGPDYVRSIVGYQDRYLRLEADDSFQPFTIVRFLQAGSILWSC